MFTSLHLRLICFPCLALFFYVVCFELSDISLLGKTRCRRKRLTAYFPSLKLFLPLPSVAKFAKQANLACHRVFVRVFLLCSSWMYFLMGWSKAINLFELCLWFTANVWENLSKLVETLQTSLNKDWRGAKNNVNVFAKWLIHSYSWFLIGWCFSHVWESRFSTVIGWKNFRMSFSCDRFYPKISVSMK